MIVDKYLSPRQMHDWPTEERLSFFCLTGATKAENGIPPATDVAPDALWVAVLLAQNPGIERTEFLRLATPVMSLEEIGGALEDLIEDGWVRVVYETLR